MGVSPTWGFAPSVGSQLGSCWQLTQPRGDDPTIRREGGGTALGGGAPAPTVLRLLRPSGGSGPPSVSPTKIYPPTPPSPGPPAVPFAGLKTAVRDLVRTETHPQALFFAPFRNTQFGADTYIPFFRLDSFHRAPCHTILILGRKIRFYAVAVRGAFCHCEIASLLFCPPLPPLSLGGGKWGGGEFQRTVRSTVSFMHPRGGSGTHPPGTIPELLRSAAQRFGPRMSLPPPPPPNTHDEPSPEISEHVGTTTQCPDSFPHVFSPPSIPHNESPGFGSGHSQNPPEPRHRATGGFPAPSVAQKLHLHPKHKLA